MSSGSSDSSVGVQAQLVTEVGTALCIARASPKGDGRPALRLRRPQ